MRRKIGTERDHPLGEHRGLGDLGVAARRSIHHRNGSGATSISPALAAALSFSKSASVLSA